MTETDPAVLAIPAVPVVVQPDAEEPATAPDEAKTFTREYGSKLRDEAAGHRVKASAPTRSPATW